MHFFKLLGGALILGCGMALSVMLSRYERARVRQGAGFLSLLCFIRAQIDCFSLPFGHILANCDAKLLADCGVETAEAADFKELLGHLGAHSAPASGRHYDNIFLPFHRRHEFSEQN